MKKKQTIEEIAKIIYKDFQAPSRYIAEQIYNAKYRKESDTAREIFDEIDDSDIIVVNTQEYGEIEVLPIERLKEIVTKRGVDVK